LIQFIVWHGVRLERDRLLPTQPFMHPLDHALFVDDDVRHRILHRPFPTTPGCCICSTLNSVSNSLKRLYAFRIDSWSSDLFIPFIRYFHRAAWRDLPGHLHLIAACTDHLIEETCHHTAVIRNDTEAFTDLRLARAGREINMDHFSPM